MTIPPKKTKDLEYSKLNQAEQGVASSTPASTPLTKATPIIKKKKGQVTTTTHGVHPPPFGLPEGGTWGTNTHHGGLTCNASAGCCICCGGIAACVVCCFPFDKRRVYMIDRKVYDAHGSYIGTGDAHFRDEAFDGYVDENQQFKALMFAGVVGLCGFVVLLTRLQ